MSTTRALVQAASRPGADLASCDRRRARKRGQGARPPWPRDRGRRPGPGVHRAIPGHGSEKPPLDWWNARSSSPRVLVWAVAPPRAQQEGRARWSFGSASDCQEDINAVLLDQAGAGKRVARLKEGGSYVFGRGFEEVLRLQQAGSRSVAAPAPPRPSPYLRSRAPRHEPRGCPRLRRSFPLTGRSIKVHAGPERSA